MGKRVLSFIADSLINTGAYGIKNMRRKLFVAALNDYRASNADDFFGSTQLKVGLARNFIILVSRCRATIEVQVVRLDEITPC